MPNHTAVLDEACTVPWRAARPWRLCRKLPPPFQFHWTQKVAYVPWCTRGNHTHVICIFIFTVVFLLLLGAAIHVTAGLVLRVVTATCHLPHVHVRSVHKGERWFVLGCRLAIQPGVSVLLVGSDTCYSRCCRATRLAACGSDNHCGYFQRRERAQYPSNEKTATNCNRGTDGTGSDEWQYAGLKAGVMVEQDSLCMCACCSAQIVLSTDH